jgi:hypothetical protein
MNIKMFKSIPKILRSKRLPLNECESDREEVEQMVCLARTYQQLLMEISNGKKKAEELLQLLSALTLDENYHLALRNVDYGTNDIGDNAWLYCYEGSCEQKYKPYCKFDRTKWPNDFLDQSYEVFYHLSIEKSVMGAWQAYLLSVASTMLPYIWHGGYFSRRYLLTQEDIDNLPPVMHYFPSLGRKKISVEGEISPKVWFKGDNAYVSCCYWNNWKGVVYETIVFKYDERRIISGKRLEDKILYKYFNPMRY